MHLRLALDVRGELGWLSLEHEPAGEWVEHPAEPAHSALGHALALAAWPVLHGQPYGAVIDVPRAVPDADAEAHVRAGNFVDDSESRLGVVVYLRSICRRGLFSI